jgi:hypothetical protein
MWLTIGYYNGTGLGFAFYCLSKNNDKRSRYAFRYIVIGA